MTASELLGEMARALELAGENPFRVRAFEKAAHAIDGRDDLVERAKAGTLAELEGVGKGISGVLAAFLLQGDQSELVALRAKLPRGLEEIASLPGLGPKKARQLVDALDLSSLADLEYACRENRLAELKGFGEKSQAKILGALAFRRSTKGLLRLGDALPWAERIAAEAGPSLSAPLQETGALRRRLEVVDGLDYLFSEAQKADAGTLERYRESQTGCPPVRAHFASAARWGYELVRTTATTEHWAALGSPEPFDCEDEAAFYRKLGLPLIPAECRETGEEIGLARAGKLAGLFPEAGVRGVFHNHTRWSDGSGSVEEMVAEAERLGYEYVGISDHSQSAHYANGLKPDRLRAQEKEIRAAAERHPRVRVFWGIESDILEDGSLDYDARTLSRFDFVVASIHSRFQMDRKTMTERVLRAIRDPHTRFLGHPTGRLLLGRAPFELDLDRVIRECAQQDVAVELNANPHRLDLDWRNGPVVRACETLVCINPDAHGVEGLEHARFGAWMARKALLPTRQVLNARGADEVARWLRRG